MSLIDLPEPEITSAVEHQVAVPDIEQVSGGEQTICTECGEVVPFDAKICRFCRRTRLRDVFVQKAPADPREVYRLAKEAVDVLRFVDFAATKEALHKKQNALVAGATPPQVAELQSFFLKRGVELELRLPTFQWRKYRLHAGAVALAVVCLIGLFAWKGSGKDTVLSGEEIAEQVMPNVVIVRCKTHIGTGFFVTDSTLITNEHVTCGRDTTLRLEDDQGNKFDAVVDVVDPVLDIARLRLISGTARGVASLGDASHLQTGATVYVAGSPKALDFTLSRGIVSRESRFLEGLSFIQTDASVNPGNSGGPLLDERGRVIGVVSLKGEGEGIGYALPINYLYDDEGEAFVPRPDSTDATGWTEVLRRVADVRRERIAEIERLTGRVLPVAAFREQSKIKVLFGAVGVQPKRRRLRFELRGAAERSCKFDLVADGWEEGSAELVREQGQRTQDWLKEQFPDGMYLFGTILTSRRGCDLETWNQVEEVFFEDAPSDFRSLPIANRGQ